MYFCVSVNPAFLLREREVVNWQEVNCRDEFG